MNKYLKQIKVMTKNNKYSKWYIELCQTRLTIKRELDYIEKHHMLPSCFKLGGEKDKLNLVYFTPQEHFLSHWLLTKMFEDKKQTAQMCKAITMFWKETKDQNRKLTSFKYELLRKKSAIANRINQIGKKHSKETILLMKQNCKSSLDSTKENIRKSKYEKYGNENYNNRIKAKETCLKRYGKTSPVGTNEVQKSIKETKIKLYGNENYNNSEKMKQTNLEKYGTSVKANAKITCPHCQNITALNWFKRKHFNGKCLLENT